MKYQPIRPFVWLKWNTHHSICIYIIIIVGRQVYTNKIHQKTIDYVEIKCISHIIQYFICVSRNTWSLSLMNSWENRINDFGFRKQLISRRKPGYCWWGCDLKMLFLFASVKPNDPRKCVRQNKLSSELFFYNTSLAVITTMYDISVSAFKYDSWYVCLGFVVIKCVPVTYRVRDQKRFTKLFP